MQKKKSIKAKTTAVLVILIILVVSLSGITAVNKGISLTKKLLGNQTYKVAVNVAENVPINKLQRVMQNMDDKTRDYIDLQRMLSDVRAQTGLKYLYTMTRNSKGQYIYLVDGSAMTPEEFSPLGTIEEERDYYKSYDSAMSGQIVQEDFSSASEWGYIVSTYIPLRDSNGKVIAFLGADLDAAEMMNVLKANTFSLVVIISLITLLGALAAVAIAYGLTNPIARLGQQTAKINRGEYQGPIELDRDDEIGDIAQTLNNRIQAVRNILNNAEQGFLTFGPDLIVEPEYSRECKRIFGMNIEGMKVPELLYPDNSEGRTFLNSILREILKNHEKRQLYISLLPKEILLRGKNLGISYKIISGIRPDDERFMFVITDITDKRQLENSIERERDIFRMVVKVTVNSEDFFEVVRNFKAFYLSDIHQIVGENVQMEEMLFNVFRHIHTFKGSFGQLEMKRTAERLHQFETKLTEIKRNMDTMPTDALIHNLLQENFESYMEEDLQNIQNIMGEQFMENLLNMEGVLMIDKSRIINIERKIISHLSPEECKLLLPELKQLRYRSFKDLLKGYPEYVENLAVRMDKLIYPMTIEGGDFLVEAEKYINVTRSLTHLFKNAVVHGIEPPDQRISMFKNEIGLIDCKVETTENQIQLTIQDDGIGINLEKVKAKAVAKGVVPAEEAHKLSIKEICHLVFIDEITTKDEVNEFSGRGVGLSAVLKEVEEIKGSIDIKTTNGCGTAFIIKLPYFAAEELVDISVMDIMNPLMHTIKKFMEEVLAEDFAGVAEERVSKVDKPVLYQYTAKTSTLGVLACCFTLSFETSLAKQFTKKFLMVDYTPEEEALYLADAIAECLNVVLGNSIKLFPGLEELITFSAPEFMTDQDCMNKIDTYSIWNCVLQGLSGKLSVNLIARDEDIK